MAFKDMFRRVSAPRYTFEKARPTQATISKERNFIPRGAPEEEEEDYEKYIRDLIGNGLGRIPIVYSNSDWEKPNKFFTFNGQKEYDFALNLQPSIEKYNNQRLASRNPVQDFNSYLRELDKLIKIDTERLAGMQLPEYKNNLPQMSTLTQKADLLRAERNKSGIPNKRKIDELLKRTQSPKGFNKDQVETLTNRLYNEGNRSANDILKNRLFKEFESNYEDREVDFDNNNKNLLGAKKDWDRINLDKYNEQLGLAEQNENISLIDTLLGLGKNKDDRKKTLINKLDEFGNQQHNYDTLVGKGKKKAFDVEAFQPIVKLANLKTAKDNISSLEPGNPRAEGIARSLGNKALADYGVFVPSSSEKNNFKFWDNNRVPTLPILNDDLIEQLTPEVLESQYSLQRISPKVKGESTDVRKIVQRDIYGDKNTSEEDRKAKSLSSLVFKNNSESSSKELSLLDKDMNKEFEKEMNKLGHKYMRLRQYRSESHMKEAEKVSDYITDKFADRRSKILFDNLQNDSQVEKTRQAQMRDLLKLSSNLENDDFLNTLHRVQETNDIGIRNWSNLQAKRDQTTNSNLNQFNQLNNIPNLNNTLKNSFSNKTQDANLQAKIQDYINRGVFENVNNLENLNSRNSKFVPFNTSDKAIPDSHLKSLSDPTEQIHNGSDEYIPLSKKDAVASQTKYNNYKAENEMRKKVIREKHRVEKEDALLLKKEREENDFSGQSLFDLRSLINGYNSWKTGGISLNRLAHFIQENTGVRFPFDSEPVYGQSKYSNSAAQILEYAKKHANKGLRVDDPQYKR